MKVLVAEDNEMDAQILRLAANAVPGLNLRFVHDGQELIHYLQGDNGFADRIKFPLPEMILLDLKMPRVDGMDFLTWRREQASEDLRAIPTVVFTNSNHHTDVKRAYVLGANRYMTKPSSLATLRERLKLMVQVWKEHSELPFVSA